VHGATAGSPTELGEAEIRIPIIEEEVVVEKRPVVREKLVVKKREVEETKTVEVDLRRERVDVDDATGSGSRSNTSQGRGTSKRTRDGTLERKEATEETDLPDR
jgi:stress response protein YsnF